MRRWFRQWLARRQEDSDLSEELRAHLLMEAQQRMEAGESPGEAMHAARRAFGSVANIQEDVRESWGWAGIERFAEDIRFGLRMLRRTPVWTAAVSSMLALGIGLSTAIFSVVYGVLLQPLPYPDADRLVALWPTATKNGVCALQCQRRALGRMAEGLDPPRGYWPHPAHREFQSHRRGRAGASAGSPDVVQCSARPGHGPAAGQGIQRAGTTLRCACCLSKPCLLDEPVRRRSRNSRPEDSTQRRALRSHWRDAAAISLPQCGLPTLDAALHSTRRDRPWDEPSIHLGGPH